VQSSTAHVLADCNQDIQVMEKMLEFTSAVLSRPSPYLFMNNSSHLAHNKEMTFLKR